MVDSPLAPATKNTNSLAPAQSAVAPPNAQPQYSPEFINSDAFVAYTEGGKTYDDGTGHKAAFGIDQNAHPEIDVLSLTPREAQAIRHDYWKAIGGDVLAKVDPKAAFIAYDTAIAAGPQVAIQLIRSSGGDANKMYQARVNFMENLVAKDPKKFGPVATTWRSINDNMGKTLGIIPGTPNMPPLDQLKANGLYVPTGYSADVNTPPATAGKSIRHGTAPNVAQAEPKAETPPETPPEEPPNPLQEGISGALKAETQAPAAPAIPVTKPNIALPTGAIAPNQRELYAKALERISQRNASTPPTQAPPQAQQPQQAQQAQPQTATAPQQTAPVKEEQVQNEPEA